MRTGRRTLENEADPAQPERVTSSRMTLRHPTVKTPAPTGPLTAAERQHLLSLATCAPSVYNTQPWRFTATPDGFLLSSDRTRQLAVLDPDGRQMLLSCGAACHHLGVAARAMGLDVHVELLPDEGVDAVARFHLTRGGPATAEEIALSMAVLTRHSDRGRYTDAPLPAGFVDGLLRCVEAEGAILRVVRADELPEVDALVSQAEQVLLNTPGYAAELSTWVWHDGERPDRGDGLSPESVAHGTDRAESLQGRAFDAVLSAPPAEPPPAEHPHVMLLTTTGDEPLDRVRAGMALSALLLSATQEGLSAQVFGQVTDVPVARWALKAALGTLGQPQILLRLGAGSRGSTSTRRSVPASGSFSA